MGGLWVDYRQRTNIPGLFAAGECDYSIHGANRLGANSLVSCVYGGFVAAPSAIDYAKNVERGNAETNGVHSSELKRQQEINDNLIRQTGTENQYQIHEEMGKWMTDNVTVVRYNDRLKATDEKLLELQDRLKRISINDSNLWATQAVPQARQLKNMLELARVITLGALNRDESRGAHYKPDFPDRNDERFMKTTIAEWSSESPILSYEAVDVGLIEPRKRDYSSGKAKSAIAQQAENAGLPLKDGAQQVPTPYTAQKPENSDRQNTVRHEDAQIKDGESFKEIHEKD
jgi:succinate dehydrogenase / fumarate reductase flavoprotein subunit